MLPSKVRIFEIGPRDGFQNIEKFIPTEIKVEIIQRLLETGVYSMEATSFVSPKAIPQMRDAGEVMGKVANLTPCAVLVPNMIGAKKAVEAGAKTLLPVVSISQTHNMKNVRCTVEESIGKIAEIYTYAKEQGVAVRLNLATVFGCPYEGKISESQILKVISSCFSFGIDHFTLCDTTGMANPLQTTLLIKKIQEELPQVHLGVHFHNTRGMALANIMAALEQGITDFECSIGGLGGCPFAKGASGNIATEDVVNMMQDMGIETEVDLKKLLKVSGYVAEALERDLDSQTFKAGPTYESSQTCG